jgi:hypothetical protein
MLKPDRYAFVSQAGFQVFYSKLIEVKEGCRQGGIGFAYGQGVIEVIYGAGSARGYDWDID